jgi:hypothetical protein
MLTGILISFLMLTLVAAIFHAVSYRKTGDMTPRAMLLSLAAAILAAIAFFTIGSGGSATGGYIYYVNGVRVGSGVMSVGMNIFLSFMAFVVSHFASVGIGYLFGHERDAREKGKPKVCVLVVSILAIPFGSGFFKSLSLLSALSAANRLLLLGLGAATWGLGIWGIVSYIVKKKRAGK